jgi:endonuclease/exonuclease/phosphatase (EEP) superfamily protein YafD
MIFKILKFTFIYLLLVNVSESRVHRIPPIEESMISMGKASIGQVDPKSFKILVWNILKSKRKNWKNDFSTISKDNDFLILQESYINENYLEYFNQNMFGYQFDMATSFLYLKRYPTGTMIGSKIKPSSVEIIRTSYLEPIVKTPKTSVYGLYEVEGYSKNLMVISIHGLNITRDIHLKNQIMEVFKIIASHDGPVIFAGDFNTRNKNRTNFLKKIMNKNNFKEVIFKDDRRMRVFGYALDYVFIRDVYVKKAEVLHKIYSSDHKPLFVELSIK